MRNTTNTVRIMSEIGMIAALGFVFDELQGMLFKFPSGGSIGFAMIAVLIMAYRRGLFPALATGLIMGALDLATSAYIIHPAQLFLDYLFPYMLVGFAGLLKPLYDKSKNTASKVLWLISGAVIGGLLKFLSHYLAGVIFWSDGERAWGLDTMNPYLYSFVYNIAYIGPSILLTGGLLVAIQLTAPRIFLQKEYGAESTNAANNIQKALSIITIAGGAFMFIFFLIKYIQSFGDYTEQYNSWKAYGYDFDPDSMLLFVTGLIIVGLGVNSLIKCFKNIFTYTIYLGALSIIAFIPFTYDVARLIRVYKKGYDPAMYWIWFAINLTVICVAAGLFIYSLIKNKKRKELAI